MRNNIFVVAILCIFSSAVLASEASVEAPNSLFNCLDLDNYSVDAHCSSSLISTNSKFVTLQKELSFKMQHQNPNEMATVQFYPQQMLIKVIAQKELANKTKNRLLAAVDSKSSSFITQ